MNGAAPRTGSSDQTPCATVWEKMAWYVNGTLSSAERQWVDAHVGECERCRATLALEVRIGESIRTPRDNVEPSPHEAWRKLEALIDGNPPPNPESSGAGHASERKRLPRRWRFWPLAVSIAVAAQAAVIAVLGLALVHEHRRPAPTEYRTLLSTDDTLAIGVPLVRVAFDAKMDRATVQAAAEQVNGHIVAGPTLKNVYTLAFRPGEPAQNSELDHAIAWLREQPHVVLVEPVVVETHH